MTTQSASGVACAITGSILQRRLRLMLGLGEPHVIGVVGVHRLIGAEGQNDQEREHRKADDDRREDQRLRQRIGDAPIAGSSCPWRMIGGTARVSRPATKISRLTPLPSSTTPSSTRINARDRIR